MLLRGGHHRHHRLLQALEQSAEHWIRPTVLANLGYLALIQGNYERAEDTLQQVAEAADEQSGSILRVAFWQNGAVCPDLLAHPTQFLPIRAAVRANQVTLALARGQIEDAEDLAGQLVEQYPHLANAYAVLGWAQQAQGKHEQARRSWESARERADSPQQAAAIERWLQAAPPRPND